MLDFICQKVAEINCQNLMESTCRLQHDFKKEETILYEILYNNTSYEIVVCYKNINKACIFGTGAITDEDKRRVFSRINWRNDFEFTTMYYYDPTLYLADVPLGWGYGTKKEWYLEIIAKIIEIILIRLEINSADTLFFGSSGGGTTAIYLASFLKSRATVINPQLIIENYKSTYVKKFKKLVLKDGIPLRDRVDIPFYFKKNGYIPKIHFIENLQSSEDVDYQLIPFINSLKEINDLYFGKIKVDFYFNKDGHNGMPDKDTCIKIINEDINKPLSLEIIIPNVITNNKSDSIFKEIIEKVIVEKQNDSIVCRLYLYESAINQNIQFAYYLIDNNNIAIKKIWYSENAEVVFYPADRGKYRIKVFVKLGEQKRSFITKPMDFGQGTE